MEEQQRGAIRKVLAILLVVFIIGFLIWLFFFKGDKAPEQVQPTKNNPTQTGSVDNTQNPTRSDTTTPVKPGQTTPTGTTNTTPTRLADTGPGNVLAISITVGTFAGILHYVYRRRALGKTTA